MNSDEEIFEIFNTEAETLESTINTALAKPELSIPEIIQVYYQILSVNSLIVMLLQKSGNLDERSSQTSKIKQTQRFISEKFDSSLHQSIITHLTSSINNIKKNLQSGDSEKSKESIETEAKLYEKLRETMSTKEFVEQYEKGLSHD